MLPGKRHPAAGASVFWLLMVPVNQEKIVGCAFQQLAEGLYPFQLDGGRLVVDHAAEILPAHSQLFIQPIFCFSFFLQQRQNIQLYHENPPCASNKKLIIGDAKNLLEGF